MRYARRYFDFVAGSRTGVEHKNIAIMWSTVGTNRGGKGQRGGGRCGPPAAKPSTPVGGLPTPKPSAPTIDTSKSNQASCRCASTADLYPGVFSQLEGVDEMAEKTGVESERSRHLVIRTG